MKNLEELLVTKDTTIMESLIKINSSKKDIVIVVEKGNRLLGTLTDGDIRRAIIMGMSPHCSIENVYNKSCRFLKIPYSDEQVSDIFMDKNIKCIPITNENIEVVDYIECNEYKFEKVSKDNPVLIMAGGLGTRLKPLTDDIPKPMLLVGGKPILETIIEQFKSCNFKNILISVNYKSDIIENYFRDGSDFGVNIKYIREDKRMGTAGAIKLAEDYLCKPFFVINGDILTNVRFNKLLDYHVNNKFDFTIGARNFEMQVPYGVIKIDGLTVTSLEEKPKFNFFVNGGIYVLNPSLLSYIPKDEYFDITELINILISKNYSVGSFPIQEYWMDIGQLKDYYKANEDIKKFL